MINAGYHFFYLLTVIKNWIEYDID